MVGETSFFFFFCFYGFWFDFDDQKIKMIHL